MRAMILAAGFGTRLGALSDELPKPLLPVCDQPLVRFSLALLAGHGLSECAINLHHRGERIVEELTERPPASKITWSREETILGTGGGLKRMEGWLTDGGREPFLVLNGKLVIDVDLGALIARHRASGAAATMVVREVPDPDRWGSIDLDGSGRVIRILGQGEGGEATTRTMFTGVHVISPELLARVPREGEQCIIRQGYLPSLAAGARIDALIYRGYFQEHSTPERYLDGNRALLSGEVALTHPPGPLTGADPSAAIDPSAVLRPPFRIGPGATVGAGAIVGPFSVIGRGARVEAGGRIASSVAWAGATVAGTVDHAIVTPRATLEVSPS